MASSVLESDATVLSPSPHRDVHARDDLEAREHRSSGGCGEVDRLPQEPVDAHANPHVATGFLDVDVARTIVDGAAEDVVDQAHHRSPPCRVLELGLRARALVAELVRKGGEELGQITDVVHLDSLEHGLEGGDHWVESAPRLELDVVDGGEVQRIRHRDAEGSWRNRQRKHAMHAHELRLHRIPSGGIDAKRALGVGERELHREGPRHVLPREPPQAHQRLTHPFAAATRGAEGLLEELYLDVARLDEELTEDLRTCGHRSL